MRSIYHSNIDFAGGEENLLNEPSEMILAFEVTVLNKEMGKKKVPAA